MSLMITVLEQGLIFGLLALGVYLTYRILDIPDLSVDGTLVLGAAITGRFLQMGINPYSVSLLALLGGSCAGLVTGLLHVKLKISSLLSGILVMIGLYSINLRIMGIPNVSLFKQATVFSLFNQIGIFDSSYNRLLLLLVIGLLIKLSMDLFLGTKTGMLIKTTGDNPQLVTTLGANIDHMKLMGLMISNGLVALSGSLLAQYQRFADLNSGAGTIVIGLASVIIGQTLFKRLENRWIKSTSIVVLGAIIYKGLQALTLQLGFNSNDFKLISAVLVVIALSFSHPKWGVFKRKMTSRKIEETDSKERSIRKEKVYVKHQIHG
jgi:putative tryptophan/tyrosine transport system permease protein